MFTHDNMQAILDEENCKQQCLWGKISLSEGCLQVGISKVLIEYNKGNHDLPHKMHLLSSNKKVIIPIHFTMSSPICTSFKANERTTSWDNHKFLFGENC